MRSDQSVLQWRDAFLECSDQLVALNFNPRAVNAVRGQFRVIRSRRSELQDRPSFVGVSRFNVDGWKETVAQSLKRLDGLRWYQMDVQPCLIEFLRTINRQECWIEPKFELFHVIFAEQRGFGSRLLSDMSKTNEHPEIETETFSVTAPLRLSLIEVHFCHRTLVSQVCSAKGDRWSNYRGRQGLPIFELDDVDWSPKAKPRGKYGRKHQASNWCETGKARCHGSMMPLERAIVERSAL